MASPGLSELVTTTMRNRSKKLADNFSINTALMHRLTSNGMAKTWSGGRVITHEITYARNQSFKRYSGFEQLNISPSDVFTAAEFDPKQAAIAVTISGLEQLQNSGENAVIELLESRIKNAEKSLFDAIAEDCYSDGTADGGKQIGGLKLLISDTGQGTVGGIDSATWAFWRNQVQTVGAAFSGTNIQTHMNQLWLKTLRNRDQTDLIVASNGAYRAYWESLQQIQRITNSNLGKAGFQNLKFQNADVVADGGLNDGPIGTADRMYFLNTDHVMWRPHKDRNFVALDPDRYSTNQDAVVKLYGLAANMTINNRQLQGVIKV